MSRLLDVAASVWRRLPAPVRDVVVRLYPLPRFRVGVLALVKSPSGRILLLKHRFHPRPWGLPGGWLEPGETPAAGMRRELLEELGVDVPLSSLGILDAVSRPGRPHVEILFCVELPEIVPPPNPEFTDHGYFAPDRLPLDMLPHHRGLVSRLARRP